MQIVDRDDGAAAAGILNGIVNRLSPDAHGQVTPRQSLWHAAVGTKHSTPAARQAHALYQACHEGLLHDNDAKLRWCLQLRHDALLMKLNSGYWEAVRTGS